MSSTIKRDLLHEYKAQFDALMTVAPFTVNKEQKEAKLGALLTILHQYHIERCTPYRKIHKKIRLSPRPLAPNTTIAEQPFLAVRLFKQHELSSISPDNIFKILRSSGTTGQAPAKVLLDKETSARQSKVLVNILQNILGKQRLPMLVIDAESVARGRGDFSARTAGIQGLSFFGRKHVYALNEDMSPNWKAIDEFFHQHGEGPVLIFGFTFMIWQYLIEAAIREGKSFSAKKALIIHSGGWKKLVSKAVDNIAFKTSCDKVVQGSQVHSFYGMAEQVGSIFIECEQGHLHAPNMADVVVRQAHDLSECMIGETGLIQVVSAIPTSYPGHSILTEDLGKMIGEDDCKCGRLGKYFEVLGRIPKVEVRGCSDTHE